jgi:phosphatidylglycerophosphate synthase
VDKTLNKSEIGTIDTAIVLTSSGVFDLGGSADTPVAGALARVGGMTLFQRTVFTLQHAGISRILTLVGQGEQRLRSLIDGDARLHAMIRWLPIREFPPLDPQTWETLANEVKGSCLVLGCHMVFASSLIRSLREEGKDGRAVVAVSRPGEFGWSGNPGVVMRANPHTGGHIPRVVFWDRQSDRPAEFGESQGLARVADLVVLPARLLGVSGSWSTSETSPVRLALEQAAAEGVVQTLSASSHGYQDTRGADGLQKAEHTLFRSLQSVDDTLDGVVDRYVNRRVSRPLSRLFMQLRCSPNVITLLSMIIGLGGAACFATGSYPAGIAGALLFQLAVILDCCDGEVARLTFAESPLGQALDLVSDNIVHVAVFAGIAWGAYRETLVFSGYLPLLLGGIAVLSTGVSLWGVNRVKSLKGNPVLWRRMRQADRTRFDFILGHMANRDFSIVVLACACLGVLSWFLWLVAAGASAFAAMMAWSLYRAFAFQRA